MFLLVKLHIDMRLEAVLPGPQNALYVMLCYVLYHSPFRQPCSMFHIP